MTRSHGGGSPPQSPCIGICVIDDRSVCSGCHRSLSEIGRWSIATNDEKRSILSQVQSRRYAAVQAAQTNNDDSSPTHP